jgi:hypothetical protein
MDVVQVSRWEHVTARGARSMMGRQKGKHDGFSMVVPYALHLLPGTRFNNAGTR